METAAEETLRLAATSMAARPASCRRAATARGLVRNKPSAYSSAIFGFSSEKVLSRCTKPMVRKNGCSCLGGWLNLGRPDGASRKVEGERGSKASGKGSKERGRRRCDSRMPRGEKEKAPWGGGRDSTVGGACSQVGNFAAIFSMALPRCESDRWVYLRVTAKVL